MANAYRDENSIATIIGVLDSNGTTISRVTADPTTHFLDVSDSDTGDDYGPDNATKDENNIPIMMAVSSSDDKTPVAVYVDSSGHLLVDSS